MYAVLRNDEKGRCRGGAGARRPGAVKCTPYFREQVMRKRAYIRWEWVEAVLRKPDDQRRQPDGRWQFWGYVPELGADLRVVTLEDGETVHNAFPDRDHRR